MIKTNSGLNFIGYGSLLSHVSLKETIKDKKFTPVIVKGFKRIFNLDTRKNGKTDILNLVKDKNEFFNGVLFRINDEELLKLKKREDEYNLEEVDVYNFKTKRKIGKGIIAVDYLIRLDHNKLNPNKSYLKLCRDAAYKISPEFGKMWDKTTYISNGNKVSDLIKKGKLIL